MILIVRSFFTFYDKNAYSACFAEIPRVAAPKCCFTTFCVHRGACSGHGVNSNICYDEVVILSKLFLQSSIEALIILIYLQFIEAGLPQNENSVVIVKQYRH